MTALREAAQQLLGALDKSLYMNDYCGLEVSKHDQPDVTDAIEVLRAALAEPVQEPVAWLRVIDEAMVTHHLGVADPADDYETAKRKINTLLSAAQDIGTYFAKQAEPVQEPVAWMTVRLNVPIQTTARKDVADEWLKWGEVLPLYTAPQQRKPLTSDKDRPDQGATYVEGYGYVDTRAVRAVERAHGIGGEE